MIRGFAIGILITTTVFWTVYGLVGFLAPVPWKRVSTSYFSVSFPSEWDCRFAGTEYICRQQDEQGAREALAITAAKVVGPSDTMEDYEKHLNTQRDGVRKDNVPYKSEIIEVSRRQINGHHWVVGKHLGSEIPSFETHYFATVYKDLAILVTFSFHEDKTSLYKDMGERVAESIEIVW